MKTVTLETAKKMKELGWPQVAEKWWQATYSRSVYMTGFPCYERCDKSPDCNHPVAWHIACHCEPTDEGIDIAAPTLDQILEALPDGVSLEKIDGTYDAEWFNDERQFNQKNPAEAAAHLWIKLVEEKKITPSRDNVK